MHTIRLLSVPFHQRQKTDACTLEHIGRYFEALDIGKRNTIVLTPPSIHCLDVAKQLNKLSLPVMLSVLLTVSGESTGDRYQRLDKARLVEHYPWVLTLAGISHLKDKWWPASYHPWKTTQVPKLMAKLRKFPPGMTVVIVATQEYAEELNKQLCAPRATSPMEAYEWRTFQLPTANAPPVTMLHQSAVLRAADDLTEEAWTTRLEGYLRKYCDITDTPMQAMWTKAKNELRAFLRHREATKRRSARGYVNKFAEASMRCMQCDADLYVHMLQDNASGDVFCRECGLVVSSHHMDDGAAFRTFEGEDDLNHHGTSVDPLMSVQTQLQTCQSGPVSRAYNGETKGAATVVGHKSIDKMMREDVHTRADLTTQPTKDKHIHAAASVYKRMTEDPSVHVPIDAFNMAAVVFHYKRNKETSLQPVGMSKTHRPRDSTQMQHIATALLAAALHYKPAFGASALRYVPKTLLSSASWQSKRGPTDDAPPLRALGKRHAPIRDRPEDVPPRPVKRRMTCVATMQASARALAEKRAAARRACASA